MLGYHIQNTILQYNTMRQWLMESVLKLILPPIKTFLDICTYIKKGGLNLLWNFKNYFQWVEISIQILNWEQEELISIIMRYMALIGLQKSHNLIGTIFVWNSIRKDFLNTLSVNFDLLILSCWWNIAILSSIHIFYQFILNKNL